jgi:hypothetical protein
LEASARKSSWVCKRDFRWHWIWDAEDPVNQEEIRGIEPTEYALKNQHEIGWMDWVSLTIRKSPPYRPTVWRIFLGYLMVNRELRSHE